MILKFKDVFRICLGADTPVDVPPMEIKFEEEECPAKVRRQTYSPELLDFMKKKMRLTSGSWIHIPKPFLEVGM